jgi:hypothetical protein
MENVHRVICPALKDNSAGVPVTEVDRKCVRYDDGDIHRISTAHLKKPRGFPSFHLRWLSGTHESLLLNRGGPMQVVAKRCGNDPAVLLRIHAKRTKKG